MKKLSANMWMALNYMRSNAWGIAYGTESDPTYKALGKRGLVAYNRARKYGKSNWQLTEEGKAFKLD